MAAEKIGLFYLNKNFNIDVLSYVNETIHPLEYEQISSIAGPKIVLYNLDQDDLNSTGTSDELKLLTALSTSEEVIKNTFFVICTFSSEIERPGCNFVSDKRFFIDFICRSCNGKIVSYFELADFIENIKKQENIFQHKENALFKTLEILKDDNRSIFKSLFNETDYNQIIHRIDSGPSDKIFSTDILLALTYSYQR